MPPPKTPAPTTSYSPAGEPVFLSVVRESFVQSSATECPRAPLPHDSSPVGSSPAPQKFLTQNHSKFVYNLEGFGLPLAESLYQTTLVNKEMSCFTLQGRLEAGWTDLAAQRWCWGPGPPCPSALLSPACVPCKGGPLRSQDSHQWHLGLCTTLTQPWHVCPYPQSDRDSGPL